MDVLYALPFDAAMAGRPAPDFVQDVLLDGIGASAVVVGRDFEFGKGRGGNLATLSYMGAMEGFAVIPFDTVLGTGDGEGGWQKISSTNIRALLKAARPEEAARLLGRWWAVEARVEHGDARGREFGFPTANMHLGHCLVPAFGIYAVRVDILDNERVVAAMTASPISAQGRCMRPACRCWRPICSISPAVSTANTCRSN